MPARTGREATPPSSIAPPNESWLDPRLAASSVFLADLSLCQARLQADARWPWIVLIPRRAGLSELDQLSAAELSLLMTEILAGGRAVRALGLEGGRAVEKLNTGALGNIVSQLHVHVVGRRADDLAWPGPVWGHGVPMDYGCDRLNAAIMCARSALRAEV